MDKLGYTSPIESFGAPHFGDHWEPCTPVGLARAKAAGQVVAVAFHDGWRPCMIQQLVIDEGGRRVRYLQVRTKRDGLLEVPTRLVKISVLVKRNPKVEDTDDHCGTVG